MQRPRQQLLRSMRHSTLSPRQLHASAAAHLAQLGVDLAAALAGPGRLHDAARVIHKRHPQLGVAEIGAAQHHSVLRPLGVGGREDQRVGRLHQCGRVGGMRPGMHTRGSARRRCRSPHPAPSSPAQPRPLGLTSTWLMLPMYSRPLTPWGYEAFGITMTPCANRGGGLLSSYMRRPAACSPASAARR